MVAAILSVRHGLVALGVTSPKALAPIEIAVGAVTYVFAALSLAGPTARDFLALVAAGAQARRMTAR